ncbi:MAG: hypothetical protein ACT6FF_09205 [Methanosarcinaceae archaeon]
MKFKYPVIALVLLLIFSQCSQQKPFQPIENYRDLKTAENVIFNLSKAYNEQNTEKYLACLAEDFKSTSGKEHWDKKEEREIHTNMFSGKNKAKKINLELPGIQVSTDHLPENFLRLTCHYLLSLTYQDNFTDEAQGQIRFYLKKDEHDSWKIYEWCEQNYLSKNLSATDGDSVDWFPLQVGNWWYYQSEPVGFEWDKRHEIIDTTTIENQIYFDMKITPVMADSQHYIRHEYFRKDSLSQIWRKTAVEKPEHILYKLNTTVGDTWSYQDENGAVFKISFYDTAATSRTPLGFFNNCKSFMFSDSYSNYLITLLQTLAPNIGPIDIGFECGSMLLTKARVNGIYYSPDVAVQTISWQQIKTHFKSLN